MAAQLGTRANKPGALNGQMTAREMTFYWDMLSVIGGITLESIWFQIREELDLVAPVLPPTSVPSPGPR